MPTAILGRMTEQLAFSFPGAWKPSRPRAGTVKGPNPWTARMTRQKALGYPYVEAQATGVLQSMVITDVDTSDADELPGLLGLPTPSYTALNRGTGAGHICYALGCPVCLTDAGRRRPVNLLARIEAGMRDVLGGDVGYTGYITKNPLHTDHLTLWGPDTAVYGLRELAAALDELGALPRYDNRAAIRSSNIGRNVDLFNFVRKWSYPRRSDYTDPVEWEEVVQAYAWDRNIVDIERLYPDRGPLTHTEVAGLGRSIARWTWRNIKYTAAQSFSIRQARRGQKWSQERRAARSALNRQRAKLTVADLASEVM